MKQDDDAEVINLVVAGYLTIRVVGARVSEVAVICRQIAAEADPPGTIASDPDLVLRFAQTPRARASPPSRPGRGACPGVSTVSRAVPGGGVMLAFDRLGVTPLEVIVTRPSSLKALVGPLVRLLLLIKGLVPLHVTAFDYAGRRLVAGGWSGGGKTAALLAFLERGASHVTSEWLFLDRAGRTALALDHPIRIRRDHLVTSPSLRASLPRSTSLRLAAIADSAFTVRSAAALAGQQALGDRVASGLERRAYVDVPPARLAARAPVGRPIDTIFLMAGGDRPGITVRRTEGVLIADALASALLYEHLGLMAAYLQFRYLFPQKRSDFLEGAHDRLRTALRRALADTESFIVEHPRSTPLGRLGDRMASVLKGSTG